MMMMITFNKPITVVCRMNRQGDINPFKFRLKEAGCEARTCYIASVQQVKYGKHYDEEAITYECMTEMDGEEVACNLKYIIDTRVWLLHQLNSTIGIAI